MSISTNGRTTPASSCGAHVVWVNAPPTQSQSADVSAMGTVASAPPPNANVTTKTFYSKEEVQQLLDSQKASLYKEFNAQREKYESKINQLQLLNEDYVEENEKLKQEMHKAKSVLEITTKTRMGATTDLLAHLHENPSMPGQVTLSKRQGVSGESFHPSKVTPADIQVEKYDKDMRSKQLIKDAIYDNDYLKKLDALQVKEMVDCMYLKKFPQGSLVIQEGEPGSHLYVSGSGELIVKKNDVVLGKMKSGKAFGELAILYNCTRTASVEALSDADVWVLDRRAFQLIVLKMGMERRNDYISQLSSIPLLTNLPKDVLGKIADSVEVEFYPGGEYIIRQGMSGNRFFIINQGSVKVTQRVAVNLDEEEEIRILSKGDYFGEQALLREDYRTANVIALPPGVECLALDRESFMRLIGDLSELKDKDYGDHNRNLQRPPSSTGISEQDSELADMQMKDIEIIATLGVGGFGRVELVQHVQDKNRTFALKCLSKRHILETHQQEHLYSEKSIMMACRSPFIARLYKTFKDTKCVYMLIEACLGGELWTILRDRGHFDDYTTRFYTACVVEALEYLHTRGIIYRDLKPENLLLDNSGYAKLVDFGFSKRLRSGQKTWTFCGTPEYVAPEIILNKGHDRAVDYWSLGILMFELFTGVPPFTAADPMKTYNVILKGIDMIDFPRQVTRHAHSLIKRLCRDNPTERLGYQKNGISDIKRHKWFQGFDWEGLKCHTTTPPIMPQVSSVVDTSNFDNYPKQSSCPADETSGWDEEF